MDTFLRIVGFASVPLVAASVFIMIRQLGSEYRLRVRSLVLTAAFSIAVLWLFNAVLDVATQWTAWALAAGGVVAGIVVGRITPLRAARDEVFAQRTLWAVGAWLLCFGYAQLAVLGALPGALRGGLDAMFLATGIAVGTSVSLVLRRSTVAAKGQTAASGTHEACANCSRPNPTGAQFCSQCGWHVVQRDERDEVSS